MNYGRYIGHPLAHRAGVKRCVGGSLDGVDERFRKGLTVLNNRDEELATSTIELAAMITDTCRGFKHSYVPSPER